MSEDLVADFLAREEEDLKDVINDAPPAMATSNAPENGFDENVGHGDNLDMNNTNNSVSGPPMPPIQNIRPAKEPEKIKQWRVEFKARLEKRDQDEAKCRKELQAGAEKELIDWQKHRAEQLASAAKMNRQGQQEFIQNRDQPRPGTEWERVCAMCDFSSPALTPSAPPSKPNSSAAVAAAAQQQQNDAEPVLPVKAKDTSRFRNLLLSLKSDPPKAVV